MRGVFLAKGFTGASLDELSAAAGLNRPSLYAAFGDKEQLYIATLRFYGARSIEGLDAIMAGPGTIQQRLAHLQVGRPIQPDPQRVGSKTPRPGHFPLPDAAVEVHPDPG